jgi:hypothetical protein
MWRGESLTLFIQPGDHIQGQSKGRTGMLKGATGGFRCCGCVGTGGCSGKIWALIGRQMGR